MNLNKSFLLGALLSFLGLLISCELLLRGALGTGLWYGFVDPSGDLTSRAEIEDRIWHASLPKSGPLWVVYGDSVLGATALLEHRVPQARSKTLHHRLKKDLRSLGSEVLEWGADGLLLPDIEALQRRTMVLPPRKVLLLLNFRMFAKEFASGPKVLSRSFLHQDLSQEVRDQMGKVESPNQEAFLGDMLYEGFCRHWALFREAQVLKSLWFAPSRKDVFQRRLEKLTGHDDSLDDIQEAALKQKTAGYYKDYRWKAEALPMMALRKTLDGLTNGTSDVTVVLTPQNAAFLGNYLDRPSFEANRKTLREFLKPYGAKGLRYRDWAERYPEDLFLDHCHLTPEGNERYAKDLLALLAGGEP